MRPALLAALTAMMLLQACGGGFSSRLNPFNWFKRSAPVEVVLETETPSDLRPLVDRVISLNIDSYPGGAIIRATGLPPTQGWWDAELVARPLDENGVLVYDFHVFPPPGQTPPGPQQSREIAVAANLNTKELASITQIVVQGANDARAARR